MAVVLARTLYLNNQEPCSKIFTFSADSLSLFPVVEYAHTARSEIVNAMDEKSNRGVWYGNSHICSTQHYTW